MLQPETLLDLHFVSDPQVHGSRVVFVRSTPQQKKYISNLYLWQEGELFPLTHGEHRNTSPRFSPDGQSLAFISNRSGKNQIHLLRLQGGEARQLTDLNTDPWDVQWSPDGEHLSFLAGSARQDQDVVFITNHREYQFNAEGLLPDPPDQIHLLRVSDGSLSVLTQAEIYITEHQWLPDGSGVAYISAPSDQEMSQDRQCVYLQRLQGPLQQVMEASAQFSQLAVQPDGSGFVVVKREHNWQDAHLYYYHWDGTHKRLDEGFDYPAGNFILGDMQYGSYPNRARWLDAQTLLAVYTLGGSSGLFTLKLSGEVTPLLHHHARVVSAFQVCSGKVTFIDESSTELPEVYLWEDGVVTPVSQQGNLIVEWDITAPLSLRVGNVEGWVLLPAGAAERFPVVLSIHGGPHMAYGHAFMHEFQVLVQQGYAVLYCNPRGSVGYGQSHTSAIQGCWGSVDQDDLLSFLDAALSQYSQLDPSRMAVIGGSYGGYMVNWITAHTTRFKRAITDRCLCNLVSFVGTSDIGAFFGPHEWGSNPYTGDPEVLWNLSPLKYVSQVKTPTLVVHSEQDLRCPLEQGQQWYAALKTLGIETRFVRFPEENHELSRGGRPDRRVVRLKEYLNWLGGL
ncbi:S9 family peptidase [Deinococcus roseus]|uniref:Peptidase S9 n=1 Tax=Deinococcus roseus TaxID=392414 RepID=A0ABQ2D0U8_9DEIO|nr:S9 family peptidase [Deinococcus roseus]GGJ39914.1 peptidase S9 [Deinococcus roseus]